MAILRRADLHKPIHSFLGLQVMFTAVVRSDLQAFRFYPNSIDFFNLTALLCRGPSFWMIIDP